MTVALRADEGQGADPGCLTGETPLRTLAWRRRSGAQPSGWTTSWGPTQFRSEKHKEEAKLPPAVLADAEGIAAGKEFTTSEAVELALDRWPRSNPMLPVRSASQR